MSFDEVVHLPALAGLLSEMYTAVGDAERYRQQHVQRNDKQNVNTWERAATFYRKALYLDHTNGKTH